MVTRREQYGNIDDPKPTAMGFAPVKVLVPGYHVLPDFKKYVPGARPTVHRYETNIRAHYLPEFGDRELSHISAEDVQTFLNQKRLDGKAVQTLKNLKWGLSSIFESAIKYGYITSNPASRADLPPEEVKEPKKLPTGDQLIQLIDALEEPVSTMVYLAAVSSIRPEEFAFKWLDLNATTRDLWVMRAINKGKLHTPKYHRANRPIRLAEADVQRLLALKERMQAQDDDWMFPNRIKKGKIMKPGPIWHEHLLARHIQPVAERHGLPHITWRLLRHWGATQMIAAKVDIKAAQQRLGHSRPPHFSSTMRRFSTSRQTRRQGCSAVSWATASLLNQL